MPMQDPFNLTGRGVVVTGGGGHLGQAMALALAARGAAVLVCGRTAGPLQTLAETASKRQVEGRIVPYCADISDDEQVRAVLHRLHEEAGRVDGWVNNAFAADPEQLGHMSRGKLSEALNRGLADAMMATQHVAERMLVNGGGSIVNVASVYGVVSPQPALYGGGYERFHNPPAYGAAKAGLIQFTRYAACHFGHGKVRVNALSPGPFPSPAVQEEDGFVAELEARVPIRRVGEPWELGGPLVFLMSEASSFVTGHNLIVDGGWTAW